MGDDETNCIIKPHLSRAGGAPLNGKHSSFIFLLLKPLDARSDSFPETQETGFGWGIYHCNVQFQFPRKDWKSEARAMLSLRPLGVGYKWLR